ncbi:hypothetical protein [Variovorax sp. DT-64]|uniref:hypothetical protein n=1 Tax=Variovorax sp. DT-64 TaxID=3396160 RepID=UPI003F540C3C
MKVEDLELEFVAACAALDLSGVVENLQLLLGLRMRNPLKSLRTGSRSPFDC